MRFLFLYMFLLVLIVLVTGCFETRPANGVTGEILGCIEENNRVYCVLEYPAQAVSLDAIVTDAANNGIEYENWVVSIIGEVTVSSRSIWLETGNQDVDFSVLYANDVWQLETGKRYRMTVFIDSIDRDRGEYYILAFPVIDNQLESEPVEVQTITDAIVDDANAYDYTALNVNGIVESIRDRFITIKEDTEAVFVITANYDDLISDYEADMEYTFSVYIQQVHVTGNTQRIFANLIKAYGSE